MNTKKYEVIEKATGDNHGTHNSRKNAESRIRQLVKMSNGKHTAAKWEIKETVK